MKKTKTKLYIEQNDILNFSIDHLEIYGTLKKFDDIVTGLDFDNTNYFNLDGFGLLYDQVPKYVFKVTFFYDNVPVFAFYKGKQLNDFISTKDYFVAYSSSFIMFGDEVFEIIEKYIDYGRIKRFDLALDVIAPITTIKNYCIDHDEKKSKGSCFYGKDGKLQTMYYGEKKNSINKHHLVRIYDKISDIKKKFKHHLFPEYLLEKYVTRFEIEFRKDLVYNLSFEQLKDINYLRSIFYNYIFPITDIFKWISKSKTPLKRLDKKLKTDDLSFENLLESRFLKMFEGYAKKIMDLGACPVDILLRNDMVSSLTLDDIGKCSYESYFDVFQYKGGVTTRNTKLIFNKYKKGN